MVEGERFELSKTEVNGFTARPIWPLWNPSLWGSVPCSIKLQTTSVLYIFIMQLQHEIYCENKGKYV